MAKVTTFDENVHVQGKEEEVPSGTSYRVGPQGHSGPTSGAELGLAVRAQVPTAVCKLGLVADAAGRSVVPVNGRTCRRRGLSDHRLPVAGQLLLDASATQQHRSVKTPIPTQGGATEKKFGNHRSSSWMRASQSRTTTIQHQTTL